jgi:hypothetical protein
LETAKLLDSLDDTFENPIAIIQLPVENMSADLFPTNLLTLFWQIKPINNQGNTEQGMYYFRPSDCPNCPIIKIRDVDIYAVIYRSEPINQP